MRASMRTLNTVMTIVVSTAMIAGVAGCSRSYDTTQVDAVGVNSRQAAPTTSIIVETIPPSTVAELQPLQATSPTPSIPDLQGTLTELVATFANDPDLVAAVQALDRGDLASLAAMLDIDLTELSSLGLSTVDIASIGRSVVGDRANILSLLGGLAGGGTDRAALDVTALIGILARSLRFTEIDLNALARGAIPQLIGALLTALSGAQLVITPEIVVQLDGMLEQIDPNAFEGFVVDELNAPIVALITSVILANSPLIQQGVANNPKVDPDLTQLLKQLEELNNELGNKTSSEIFETLMKVLFPDLKG